MVDCLGFNTASEEWVMRKHFKFWNYFSFDLDTHDFTLLVDIPKLRIQSHYNVDGKILLVPVKGDGISETNISKYTNEI